VNGVGGHLPESAPNSLAAFVCVSVSVTEGLPFLSSGLVNEWLAFGHIAVLRILNSRSLEASISVRRLAPRKGRILVPIPGRLRSLILSIRLL
jgi:hypothetical protein